MYNLIKTINMGQISPVPKGEYVATEEYKRLNIVTFNNCVYIAKKDTTGNEPTNSDYWMPLIEITAEEYAGLSAYEIAVKNSFEGTEAEWLASLQGASGLSGVDGQNGLSAYEIAVKNGFEGTEAEWLASLKYPTQEGQIGLSAYEIAVKNGFEGTEEEWLESLKSFTDKLYLMCFIADLEAGTLQQFIKHTQDIEDEYDEETEYSSLDCVWFENNAYVAIKDCLGIEPNNANYWQMLLPLVSIKETTFKKNDGLISYDISILPEDWEESETYDKYFYQADLDVPDFSGNIYSTQVMFDTASVICANNCSILPSTDFIEGKIRLYTRRRPVEVLSGQCVVFFK